MFRGSNPLEEGENSARRALAVGAAAAVAVALVLGALVFSNSFAAQAVAIQATVLYHAEATLGASQLSVTSLSQAVLLAEDVGLGVADRESSERAIGFAQESLAELEMAATRLIDALAADDDLSASATAAVQDGEAVLAALETGAVAEASDRLATASQTTFEDLRTTALAHRDAAAESVNSTGDLVARLGNLPAFFIAFLVPAAAILAYRRVAKSQLRMAEVQLDARLESEQKLMEAKDEFVANLSHELRTPLTSIYGFSEMLIEEGLIDPDQAMGLISLINEESAELHRMVEDLLASARYEAGTLSVETGLVDLDKELAAAAAASMRPDKSMTVKLDAPSVWADGARVRHILRNLLSNAQRHGGPRILVGSRPTGEFVELTVADDGPGVSAEKTTRLFTRYVHDGKDPLTTGSVGLGLANVKALAEAMGGSVAYDRRDGWSRFMVRLPATADARPGEPANGHRGTLPRHLAAASASGGSNGFADGAPNEVA